MVEVLDAAQFVMTDQPLRTTELILDIVAGVPDVP
jgi:hypothetical protein